MAAERSVVVDRTGLEQLLSSLAARYRVVAPTVRDGAVVHAECTSLDALPEGWHDTQAPGSYTLEHGDDPALFGWAVGPHSPKHEVLPSRAVVWRARSAEGSVALEEVREDRPSTALFGVRPCEAAGLAVLDRVLGQTAHPDAAYRARRPDVVVVAECGTPSGTCFCTSMGTGPAAPPDADLAVTELLDDGGHRFVVRAATDRGRALLEGVDTTPATDADLAARAEVLDRAAATMGRRLDTDGLAELLASNLEHPRWDEVAERCLACGNCTSVCPTCFCLTVGDTTDVSGVVTRERTWSSCFDVAHSELHSGPVRPSTRSRYRQWMTHKLSTWWDQFGESGCVGCGRCVTWCPVGIDLTEEAAAIRASDGAVRATADGETGS